MQKRTPQTETDTHVFFVPRGNARPCEYVSCVGSGGLAPLAFLCGRDLSFARPSRAGGVYYHLPLSSFSRREPHLASASGRTTSSDLPRTSLGWGEAAAAAALAGRLCSRPELFGGARHWSRCACFCMTTARPRMLPACCSPALHTCTPAFARQLWALRLLRLPSCTSTAVVAFHSCLTVAASARAGFVRTDRPAHDAARVRVTVAAGVRAPYLMVAARALAWCLLFATCVASA
jgi:hypothetical protein